jgi:hypothetical protein
MPPWAARRRGDDVLTPYRRRDDDAVTTRRVSICTNAPTVRADAVTAP